jgi:ankyrin repeat protein
MGVDNLFIAIIDRNINLIEDELNAGTDINGCDSIYRKPALIHAIENDDVDMCKYLIFKGANVNQHGLGYELNRLTPLMIALQNGNPEIIALLSKNGYNK